MMEKCKRLDLFIKYFLFGFFLFSIKQGLQHLEVGIILYMFTEK